MCESKQHIERHISVHGEKLQQFCASIRNDIGALIQSECANNDTRIHEMSKNLTDQHSTVAKNLTESINEYYPSYQNWIKDEVESALGTMERKDECLKIIYMKLAQDIDNSIKTAVAKNMEILRNNLSEKLKQTSVEVNEMIDSAYDRDRKACDRMKKEINSMKIAAEELRKKQGFTQKQRSFAKMMEDVSVQFNLLTENEKKHYAVVTNKCNNINEICNKVNDHSTDVSGTIIKMRNNLKEQIDNNLKKVEATVTVETEKIEKLSNRTEGEGKILLDELDSHINTSYNASKQYQDLVKSNLKEMQQTMDVDKNEYLSVINDMHKTIADVSEEQVKVVIDQGIKTCNTFEKISNEFDNQIGESNARSNNVVEKLDATVHEINKFFDEDVQRDIPTGTTPARKEFSYARQFTVTSPHERILQRFREVRELVETVEDEEN